jgi:hypothetical protein
MLIIITEQGGLSPNPTLYPIVNQYIHQQLHLIKYNSLQLLKLIHDSAPGCKNSGSYRTKEHKQNVLGLYSFVL